MRVLQVMATDIHTDNSDNLMYHIPLMANTNIVTGYTYIPVIVFLQALPEFNCKCPVAIA